MLDFALFVAIAAIILSYFYIESGRQSVKTIQTIERENLNAKASRVMDELMQTNVDDLNFATVQPSSMEAIESPLIDDLREITASTEHLMELLEGAEDSAMKGEDFDEQALKEDIRINSIIEKADGVVSSILETASISIDVFSLLDDNVSMIKDDFCEVMDKMNENAEIFDTSLFCGSGEIELINLDQLLGNATDGILDVKSLLQGEYMNIDHDSTPEEIKRIRCRLKGSTDALKTYLSYVSVGIDPNIRFSELTVVPAKIQGKVLPEALGEAFFSGGRFSGSDTMRSLGSMATLLVLRDKHMELGFLNKSILNGTVQNLSESVTITEIDHNMWFVDENVTRTTITDGYLEMEVTFPPSRKIGVLLRLLTPEEKRVSGSSHSKYFDNMNYILNISVEDYNNNVPHSRKVNTSKGYLFGRVYETGVEYTNNSIETPKGLNADEQMIRNYEINVTVFQNGSLQGFNESLNLSFTLLQERTYQTYGSYNYTNETGSDATKSMLIGFLFSYRAWLLENALQRIAEKTQKRLSDQGYGYNLVVSDCCTDSVSTLGSAIPEDVDIGMSRAFFRIDDNGRGKIALQIWKK